MNDKREIALIKIFDQKRVWLYCFISTTSLIICVLYMLITKRGTDVFDWLVLGTSNDWELADFFRHIGYASNLKRTYYVSNDACFPPLSYLFFHLLYLMNPLPKEITADNWQAYALYPYEILLLLFVMLVTGILFYEVIRRINYEKPLAVTVLLLTSAPLFIALERGNPIFPVSVMILWAIFLRDQDEKWKKELALILISISAGFKIYPAILGLLYIKEKRFAEMRRLLVYGLLLFFLPFIFTGGINGFKQFLKVLSVGHYSADFMKEWSSIRGLCRSVFTKAGVSEASSIIIGVICENLFLLISVIMAFLATKKWKTLLFLSAPMAYYMPTSWCYNMVFFLFPFIVYLSEVQADKVHKYDSKSNSAYNAVYIVLFSVIFSVPIWGLFKSITKLICFPGYVLWFVAAVEETALVVKQVKNSVRK